MPADQGENQRQRVLAYGGSDDTYASFNRTRYTVRATRENPQYLGEHSNADISVSGVIGAESGSQTLFFRLEIAEEARLEIRRVRVNRYTDQYISFNLREKSGYSSALELLEAEPADEANSYSERLGAIVPAGGYDLVISSSQWVELPYELQVVIKSLVKTLEGEAVAEINATGDIALRAPTGEAVVSVLATGRLMTIYSLQGEATAEVPAVGSIERISPFA